MLLKPQNVVVLGGGAIGELIRDNRGVCLAIRTFVESMEHVDDIYKLEALANKTWVGIDSFTQGGQNTCGK
ncbi:uncharacterized protein G2W53_017634 [Senna tora]|uniref:Uncharacterized protein n=1 Tax=Senna tora TaxID=362788 RepID=A0A834TQP0_9FABA|nr:uncharacterized protein G2W53_017634 [Senna tora]